MISGKHAMVTGGGKGIGLAVSLALQAHGAKVSIVSRTAPDVGKDVASFSADVTDEESLSRAFDAARELHGPISILVNNAGVAESAPFKRTDRALWDRVVGTNLTGTYLATRLVAEAMVSAKWGRVINIASIAGLYGHPYLAAYTASKHGVMGLTRALAAEFEHSGMTVNAICPGYTEGEMMNAAIEKIVQKTGMPHDAVRAQLAQANPAGRWVSPDEIAHAAIALCLDGRNGAEVILPPPGAPS